MEILKSFCLTLTQLPLDPQKLKRKEKLNPISLLFYHLWPPKTCNFQEKSIFKSINKSVTEFEKTLF
jgi:hypothetical protein